MLSVSQVTSLRAGKSKQKINRAHVHGEKVRLKAEFCFCMISSADNMNKAGTIAVARLSGGACNMCFV